MAKQNLTTRKIPVGAGDYKGVLDKIWKESYREVRDQKVKLKEFSTDGLGRILRTKVLGKSRGKYVRGVRVLGASGEETVSQESKLKVMTDPYSHQTRMDFVDVAYTDPNLSPSFERRKDSQYENGFEIEFELASSRDPATDEPLTEEQRASLLSKAKLQYLKILQRIRTWADDINLEEIMDEFNPHELNQGRCAAFFYPGLLDLVPGEYPQSIEIIPAEDLREPIVDVGIGRKLVAINTSWKDRRIVRADEVVYGIRKNWMLRKDSRFFGASILEPILTMSKALKRIYNYDIPEAVTSSYITKVIFKTQSSGDEDEQKTQIQALIEDFLATGKLAYGVNEEIQDIIQIKNEVDTVLIEKLEMIMVNTILAVIGVPKSMLNRQQGITRDIATIESILFKKFVVKPDERHIGKLFEDQLLNPLFALHTQQKLRDLPVRLKIIPIERDEPGLDLTANDMSEQKTQEINNEAVEQPDAKSVFGAGGRDALSITSSSGNSYEIRKIGPDKTGS